MFMRFYKEGILKGIAATAVLSFLVVAGSRRLLYFDAALIPYLFATLFAVFGSVSLQCLVKPPADTDTVEAQPAICF